MAAIKEIKTELRHHEWREQIQECHSSGLTVKEWCSNNGINISTYYSRLRIVREEILSRKPELHSIVPVSLSTELSEQSTAETIKTGFSDTTEHADRIIIRKNDVEIEIPCNASENTITAMMRGLKEC